MKVEAWKAVTDSVHKAGGKIYCQVCLTVRTIAKTLL